MDPKVIMFQSVAKMLGVSPEMLLQAVETVATAGERLKRVEAKLDEIARYLAERDAYILSRGIEADTCNGHGAGRRWIDGLPVGTPPRDD